MFTDVRSFLPWQRYFRVAACISFLGLSLVGSALPADDETFREFDRSEVPSPTELYQALSILQASQGLSGTSDDPSLKQLEELSRSLLSKLNREQQDRFYEIARDYFAQGKLPDDQSTMDIAKHLQRQLANEPILRNAIRNHRNLQQWLQRAGDAFKNPNNSAPNVPRTDSSDAPVPSPGDRSPAVGDGKSRSPGSMSSKTGKSNRSDPRTGPPDSRNLNQQPRSRSGSPSNNPAQRSPQSGGPQEYIGNRFDRILVQAVERVVDNQANAQSGPGIGQAVNSVLDRLLKDMHQTARANGPEFKNELRAQWDRLRRSTSKERSRASRLIPWRPWQSGSLNTDVSLPVWFAVGAPILMALLVIGWFAMRNLDSNAARATSGKQNRFRMPRVRTPGDLIVAVDRLLVARFGSASQWWHAGRAKAALCDQHPQYLHEISELLGHYEHARYSTTADSLTLNQLNHSVRTITQLATQWRDPSGLKSLADEPNQSTGNERHDLSGNWSNINIDRTGDSG